jgi:ribose transport system ATP-binding protein
VTNSLNKPVNDPVISSQEYWLEITGLSKAYGGVPALKGVSLKVRVGKVHGLVGANGAGKSTLVKCLAGAVVPDSGEIKLNDEVITISEPADAAKLGFSFIHQEVSVIPNFDVFRNMALGVKPSTNLGIINWSDLRAKAEAIHKQLSMTFSLNEKIENLSVADKWLVLIGRALMQDSRLIVMDEPTASLSIQEINSVHKIVSDLTASGVTIVYISHRLDEILEICEDITVFRDGTVVDTFKRGNVEKRDLVRSIVGKEMVMDMSSKEIHNSEVVLAVSNISDKKLLRDISFSLHKGEILGFSGLVGGGRTELAKIIFGAGKRTVGKIVFDGQEVNFKSPFQAVRKEIGFVPEERRSQGTFMTHSIVFNISIASLKTLVYSKFIPLLRPREMSLRASELCALVTVNTKNMKQRIGTLSGGNQQKVVIARWLGKPTKLLILDEPSRGVDVGAREEIHHVVRELAKKGTSIIIISSDDEELELLCDRVLVMREGAIVAEVTGNQISANTLTALSFGTSTDFSTRS